MPDLDHKEVLKLLAQDWEADRENRESALEDMRFVANDQWTASERAERRADNRPCLTINHLTKFVNQVGGDMRQGRFAIEVFPVDTEDNADKAKLLAGLIRQIEYRSTADQAYAHGGESMTRCGIGHWRITTVAPPDSPFEQEICIERVADPLSVLWDANAFELDRSDAKRCFAMEWIHKSAWASRFERVERQLIDIPLEMTSGGSGEAMFWRRDDFVLIGEYWHVAERDRDFVLLTDGRTFDVTEWAEEDIQAAETLIGIAKRRTVKSPVVTRRMMDGIGWLEDEEEWAGMHIPFVPCIGVELAFDGKIVRKGLITDAKDSQKMLNIWRSAAAEVVSKSPASPWLVTRAMVKGFESYWARANSSGQPYLIYNPDKNAPQGPKREAAPTIPTAVINEAAIATDDMKSIVGLFDASVGARSNETSGRAILARQREGDVGTFVFLDSYGKAIKRTGVILLDLIPRIYDTERQIRIIQPDDDDEFVAINVQVQTPDGEPIIVNDLSVGRFDARVQPGASFTTARVEAREQMAQAMQTNPNLWSVIGDLFFKNSDYPGAPEIAERIRRTIPRQILEDIEEGGGDADPIAEAAARLSQEREIVEIAKIEAQGDQIEADTEEKRAQTAERAAKTEKTLLEAAEIEARGEAIDAGVAV